MEAKDTVMSYEAIKPHWFNALTSSTEYGAIKDIVETQAEISFKAGMREVVEWIKKYHTDAPFYGLSIYITEDEWLAFLKDNGLEEK